MDDNVMAKYTTKSSQARHYVQYDQGECAKRVPLRVAQLDQFNKETRLKCST